MTSQDVLPTARPDVAPSEVDALLDCGDEPVRATSRTLKSGVLALMALTMGAAMVAVIKGCLLAGVEDSAMSSTERADLVGYVHTGTGGPRHIGYEIITVINSPSTYGVIISAD